MAALGPVGGTDAPSRERPARRVRGLVHELDSAISLAQRYLIEQADQSFAEARHDMVFPRWAGFRAATEEQSGDVFARAVLGSVWLDVAELVERAARAPWLAVARREADYVASARLTDREGGWSYFPDLPELPPDLDSLSAALLLFARVAPQHLPLCEDPIRWVLEGQGEDGSFKTWIVAPTNSRSQLRSMRRGIRWFWGDAVDVEVCARFLLALESADRARFADVIRRGADFIVARQRSSGFWTATWYWGDVYGTGLCLRLLRTLGTAPTAVSRATDAVRRSQRGDGGWGRWESVPLDTALALQVLAQEGAGDRSDRVNHGSRFLLAHQAPDGSWPATPWIKMDVGRAAGRVVRTLTYQSETITTAFALRSLLLARRSLESSISSSARS